MLIRKHDIMYPVYKYHNMLTIAPIKCVLKVQKIEDVKQDVKEEVKEVKENMIEKVKKKLKGIGGGAFTLGQGPGATSSTGAMAGGSATTGSGATAGGESAAGAGATVGGGSVAGPGATVGGGSVAASGGAAPCLSTCYRLWVDTR